MVRKNIDIEEDLWRMLSMEAAKDGITKKEMLNKILQQRYGRGNNERRERQDKL